MADREAGDSQTADRVAIVTGAAGAMGSEVAAYLADRGLRVACADIKDPAGTCARITAAGGSAFAAELDVAEPASWASLVAGVESRHGRLDALVNVAGTLTDGPDSVFDVDADEWRRVLGVNVIGTALGMQAAALTMRRTGAGRIVNVASVVGLRGSANCAAYSASKGALIALTRQAAVDLAKHGITVNCITPGVMDRSMLGRDTNTDKRRRLLDRPPINRPVQGLEVAAAAEYFLSHPAAIVTGQVLSVDGGWAASLRNGRGD
jgi:NAD(P)-dependent dehydrogenase (short-subunit alcohol dehydrogenase family)